MVDLYEEIKKNLESENLSNLETNLNKANDLNEKTNIINSAEENNTINIEETIISDNDSDTETTINSNTEVTNCLSLTVKKDYSLSIVKNVFIKAFKTSWKVVVSVLTLNFLKFFF